MLLPGWRAFFSFPRCRRAACGEATGTHAITRDRLAASRLSQCCCSAMGAQRLLGHVVEPLAELLLPRRPATPRAGSAASSLVAARLSSDRSTREMVGRARRWDCSVRALQGWDRRSRATTHSPRHQDEFVRHAISCSVEDKYIQKYRIIRGEGRPRHRCTTTTTWRGKGVGPNRIVVRRLSHRAPEQEGRRQPTLWGRGF